MRILVVDDDPALRRAVRRLLQASGHEIVDAGAALHAIELATKGDKFDLALLDWELGSTMTGLDVAAAIRFAQKNARPNDRTALALVTGHTAAEMRVGWKDPMSGILAIVSKDNLAKDLPDLIERVENARDKTDPSGRRP